MNKYLVIEPFSITGKVTDSLVINGDIVYAEKKLKMYHCYSGTTKKNLGKVSETTFEAKVMLIPSANQDVK